MKIQERVESLRQLMEREKMDFYVVPTDDFHGSEYVGDYFKARTFMTGFTGSAGVFVLSKEFAGLWTDGRYFLQAAEQLKDTGITLMKMGEEGVPRVAEYIGSHLSDGQTLGFDGRVISAGFVEEVRENLQGKKMQVAYEKDLVNEIWQDRPELSCEPVWILDEKYSGRSYREKILEVRNAMKEKGADVLLLTALDDIAWLFNIRGNDIAYNPVVLSYALITEEKVHLFLQKNALDPQVRKVLEEDQVLLQEYHEIYEYVKTLSAESILLDDHLTNYALLHNLPENIRLIKDVTPVMMLKSIKNPTEIQNMRNAHVKDGVAVTKFMYWLKKNAGVLDMDELSVDEKLTGFRKEMDGYIELSFETIAGYGEHGAVIHYSATEETNAKIYPEGFLLVDSGAQYMEGTTDITRTFALGPVTEDMKKHFTLVLKGNLNLGAARFRQGCTGENLDILARRPLWEAGLDYNHGTGHGVGYLLNVHETPNRISWQHSGGYLENEPVREGRVISNEPGLYLAGAYGIRLENLMVCQKAEKNEYAQFMKFETLTLVPFDLDAVDVALLDSRERELLNEYHAEVYEKISPYLEEEEKNWLKQATRAV